MNFTKSQADLLVPDATPLPDAVSRTTHLGIGAHADDLEFMAYHGILECFQCADLWFGGVTCTNGSGSSRSGPYAAFSDARMQAVRVGEQHLAARIGQYGFMAQLGFTSAETRDPGRRAALVDDLEAILRLACPESVYTHSPFDRHPTHVGVFLAVLEAIRRLPAGLRPRQLLGCEVWRDLDWLPDALKVVQPLDGHPNLAAALAGVFDSQIAGGKRYDLAVEGRRRANATYLQSHASDQHDQVGLAVDLGALVRDDSLSPAAFAAGILDSFRAEVLSLLPH